MCSFAYFATVQLMAKSAAHVMIESLWSCQGQKTDYMAIPPAKRVNQLCRVNWLHIVFFNALITQFTRQGVVVLGRDPELLAQTECNVIVFCRTGPAKRDVKSRACAHQPVSPCNLEMACKNNLQVDILLKIREKATKLDRNIFASCKVLLDYTRSHREVASCSMEFEQRDSTS